MFSVVIYFFFPYWLSPLSHKGVSPFSPSVDCFLWFCRRKVRVCFLMLIFQLIATQWEMCSHNYLHVRRVFFVFFLKLKNLQLWIIWNYSLFVINVINCCDKLKVISFMMKYFIFTFSFFYTTHDLQFSSNSMHFQFDFSPKCKTTQHRCSVTDKDVVQYHILKIVFVFMFINKMS